MMMDGDMVVEAGVDDSSHLSWTWNARFKGWFSSMFPQKNKTSSFFDDVASPGQ
jgi:hypothetical protein